MEHVRLGRTGLKVSRACLGTMTFGYQCDEDTSFAILDRATELGITFIDTADIYPIGAPWEQAGRTEDIIGRWLQGKRAEVILATKCWAPMGRRPWQGGLSRQHIIEACDNSLRRLQTDHIDLYQAHFYDAATPIDETLAAFDHLVQVGKVRYLGVSNWLAYQLARALGRSEAQGWASLVCVQPRYNLLFREPERELLPLCVEEGIGVIPYNPLAGGFLTGKHRAGVPTEGTRFTLGNAAGRYQDRYWHDREFETVDALKALASEAGMPMATLAVAWCAANPAITSPIIGASRPGQLDDSVAGVSVALEPDLKATLDELTAEYRRGDVGR
ncbi:MAG TPA: aldo/keto reductase [Acidimicrobiales bacterium]